jgi:hypothetical protein
MSKVYEVTSPDGKTFEVTAPDGASEQEIIAYAQSQFSQAPKPASGGVANRVSSWANQAIAGVPDAVLNTPTNVMNLAKAGFGTAATALGRPDLAPEPTEPPSYVTRAFEKSGLINPSLDPTSTGGRLAKAGVQGLTVGPLAPAQSVKQLALNSALSGTASVVGQGTTEVTGSPEAGIAATMATVPALSAASNAARQNSMQAKSRNAMKDETLNNAREEGYVVPPSAAGGNWFTRRLESIAGKAAIGQEATVKNQEITNKIARREVGLPDDTPISVDALKARRDVLAGPYKEVAAINKTAAKALEELKQARADANGYYRHYDVSADPKSLAEANKFSQKAEALEQALEATAKRAMKPELINELRAARQAIAKTYDVERSLNVATGDVSAAVLGRAVDKGKPLSGGLGVAGKFQQAFPAYARDGERVPTPGVSKSEALMGALLGTGGFAMAGPAGTALAALPLASGPMRSLLLSRPFQGGPLYPGASLPQVKDPFLRGILASQPEE